MASRTRTLMVVLALGGLLAAGVSTYVHLQMLTDPGYLSFCDINARISCSDVYQSRYGSVAGVPVALGGVIWFVGVLLLAFAATSAPQESRTNVGGYLIVWSTVGLAISMYMAYASFIVLQTVCLLCVAVYIAVIGIFLLAGSVPATPLTNIPLAVISDLGRLLRRPVGLAVCVGFIVGSFGSLVWFSGQETASKREAVLQTDGRDVLADETLASSDTGQSEFERFWESQSRIEFVIPGSKTERRVAVVVVKFNDYQCPACANTDRLYGPIFDKYESSHPGAVEQVTLDYPLDPECNDGSSNGPHDSACEAAVAVRLARAVSTDAETRMKRWLYSNQQTLSRDGIVEALTDIAGVDGGSFSARYDVEIEEVRRDIALGEELPVEATPTYVINGIVLKGGLAPQFFDAAIAYELGRTEDLQ